MPELEIVLERDPRDQYVALICADSGELVEATRRYGSWTTVPDDSGRFREILPKVAAELQRQVKVLERHHV